MHLPCSASELKVDRFFNCFVSGPQSPMHAAMQNDIIMTILA